MRDQAPSWVHAVGPMLRLTLLRAVQDRWLVGVWVYLLTTAVLCRLAYPGLEAVMLARFDLPLAPHITPVACLCLFQGTLLVPALFGAVQLVENREVSVSSALQVSPMPRWLPRVVVYSAVMVLCGTSMLLQWGLLSGMPKPPWLALVAGVLLLMPGSAIVCALGEVFAEERLSLMASVKGWGVFACAPVLAYLAPVDVQHLYGVLPHYWGFALWWRAAAGDPTWASLVGPGLLVNVVWIGGVWRLGRRR